MEMEACYFLAGMIDGSMLLPLYDFWKHSYAWKRMQTGSCSHGADGCVALRKM
jgi:hypothetical protein